MNQQTAGFWVAQALRGRDLQLFSVSIRFPIKVIIRKAECRQINRFQSFIQSFPSFGNGFDSRRPLQILKNLLGFSSFPTPEARKASAVATVLLGGALENLLLVRSRANVPDKGTRGSLHSHNFKEVDKSVTKSLDSWGTQYLISGTGLVGAFRLRRPHRCAVRILWVYHPRHSFSGTNPNRKSFIINRFDSYPHFQRQGRGHIRL